MDFSAVALSQHHARELMDIARARAGLIIAASELRSCITGSIAADAKQMREHPLWWRSIGVLVNRDEYDKSLGRRIRGQIGKGQAPVQSSAIT